MKTAYELAMERLGGEKTLSEEQKRALAEVDKKFDGRVAEAKIRHESAAKELADPGALLTAQEELATELRRLEERREAEKSAIR